MAMNKVPMNDTADDAALQAEAEAAELRATKGEARRKWLTRLALFVGIAGLLWAAWYFLIGKNHISTDNAYVNAEIAQVTPLIAGTVTLPSESRIPNRSSAATFWSNSIQPMPALRLLPPKLSWPMPSGVSAGQLQPMVPCRPRFSRVWQVDRPEPGPACRSACGSSQGGAKICAAPSLSRAKGSFPPSSLAQPQGRGLFACLGLSGRGCNSTGTVKPRRRSRRIRRQRCPGERVQPDKRSRRAGGACPVGGSPARS